MSRFQVDPDIRRARTLHSDFYTRADIFERCKEEIFACSWQWIGHRGLAQEAGDLYPFTLLEQYLDEPLVLSRDNAGALHLLSNVCTHRGNILVEKACHQPKLRCRYHGRVFKLDGRFQSMPEFQEVEDFPGPEDDLKSLPLFEWDPWLFTSLDPRLDPQLFFAEMMQRVFWMPLEEFVFAPERSRVFQVDAHWALYCENYLEGFHIPFVHAGLNAVIDYGEYATEIFYPYASLQVGMSKDGEDCFDLPADSPDYGKQVAAYYFWVFPNMMFNFYPWGLSVNLVEPLTPGSCKVSFFSYVWDASKLHSGAGAELDQVELEDEEIVKQVQRGVRSRFYQQGRYSPAREQGTHHFHRLLAQFLSAG